MHHTLHHTFYAWEGVMPYTVRVMSEDHIDPFTAVNADNLATITRELTETLGMVTLEITRCGDTWYAVANATDYLASALHSMNRTESPLLNVQAPQTHYQHVRDALKAAVGLLVHPGRAEDVLDYALNCDEPIVDAIKHTEEARVRCVEPLQAWERELLSARHTN